MGEKNRTLDLLDHAYRAEAWHGPALLECLSGVSAALAVKRPVKDSHTIWELVDHITSWNEIVALRLSGEKPAVTPGWNFPPTPRPTPARHHRELERAHPRPDPAPALSRRADRDTAPRAGEGGLTPGAVR